MPLSSNDQGGGREGGPRSAFAQLLFPDPPRTFAWHRGIKIGLRAVHVLCAGLLVGAHLFAEPDPTQHLWWVATAVSGFAMLALDLGESGAFLLQTRGWFVLAKIGALAAIPVLEGGANWLLVPTFLLAVLMSHAPSKVRYHMLVGQDRVRGAKSKG